MGGYHGSVLCILSLFVVFISCLSLGVDFSELVCRGRCSAAVSLMHLSVPLPSCLSSLIMNIIRSLYRLHASIYNAMFCIYIWLYTQFK